MDMTVSCGEGIINIRAGAIILKNGRFLMVGNDRNTYLYSVGGRVQFGETAEEAVVREVLEETGVRMEVDRLGFVHENYFPGDAPSNSGRLIYEISFFFYMKTPDDFEPLCESLADGNAREFLKWVTPEDQAVMYPSFFRTELQHPVREIRHFVTDERMNRGNPGES